MVSRKGQLGLAYVPKPTTEMTARGVPFAPALAESSVGMYNLRRSLRGWLGSGNGLGAAWNYTGTRKRKLIVLGNSIPRTTGGYVFADNWVAQLVGRMVYAGRGKPVIWVGHRLVADNGSFGINANRTGSWTGRGYTNGAPSDVGIFASAMKSSGSGNKIWTDLNNSDFGNMGGGASGFTQTSLVQATHCAIVYNQSASNDNAASFQISMSGNPPATVGAADGNNAWVALNMRGDSSSKTGLVSPFLAIPQQGWWLPNPARIPMVVGGVMDIVGTALAFGSGDGNGDWVIDGTVGGSKIDYFNLTAQRNIIDSLAGSDPTHLHVISGANELSGSWTEAQYRAEQDSLAAYAASKGYTVSWGIVPAPSGQTNNYIDKIVRPTYAVANANNHGVIDLGAMLGTYAYPGAPFYGDGTHFAVAMGTMWADAMWQAYNLPVYW